MFSLLFSVIHLTLLQTMEAYLLSDVTFFFHLSFNTNTGQKTNLDWILKSPLIFLVSPFSTLSRSNKRVGKKKLLQMAICLVCIWLAIDNTLPYVSRWKTRQKLKQQHTEELKVKLIKESFQSKKILALKT